MTTEAPQPAVAQTVTLYRLLGRSAAAVSFADAVLNIAGSRDRIEIPCDDIDDVIEERSLLWTRLIVRTTRGAQHTVGGLPKRDAALLTSALREGAARQAAKIGERIIAQRTEIDTALAGERYLRYGEGEQLRGAGSADVA